jgi:hypothetical protein
MIFYIGRIARDQCPKKSAESKDIAEIETEMAEKSIPGTRQKDRK